MPAGTAPKKAQGGAQVLLLRRCILLQKLCRLHSTWMLRACLMQPQKGRSHKKEGDESTGRGGRPVTWFGGRRHESAE